MKKTLVTIVCGAMLTGLAACGTTEVKEVSKSAKQEQSKKNENKVYKVGDTVEVNGLQLTFTAAKFVEANQYIPAKNGKVLEIDFTAKNSGKKQAYFGAEELKIADANGNQFKQYFAGDNTFMNENIAAGNQVQGKLQFDVTESDRYVGSYKPNFTLDNKEVKFEFTTK